MTDFWERFFREQDIEELVQSSETLEKNVEVLSQALRDAQLKIPVRLEADGTSIDLARSFVLFRPGSASFFFGRVSQENDSLTLRGKIRILPFFRVYFQVFLSVVLCMSFALATAATWKWAFELRYENRNDFAMLELAAGGVLVLLLLVGLVKAMVALNYISTRGQREKIITALYTISKGRVSA